MPKCKLCLEEKQLIKKSHIIPDFLYQTLYNEKHKFIQVNPEEVAKGVDRKKTLPTGEYEGGILCKTCDNDILGGYEDYGAKVIFGKSLAIKEKPIVSNHRNQHGVLFSKVSNLDYRKFKLFLLSILWKSSISSRPMFDEVDIGPHEEHIRKLLLKGDPGPPELYPTLIMSTLGDKSMISDYIAKPRNGKFKTGHRGCLFPIAGFFFIYYVNAQNHKNPDNVTECALNMNNELQIVHFPEGQGMDILLRYSGVS